MLNPEGNELLVVDCQLTAPCCHHPNCQWSSSREHSREPWLKERWQEEPLSGSKWGIDCSPTTVLLTAMRWEHRHSLGCEGDVSKYNFWQLSVPISVVVRSRVGNLIGYFWCISVSLLLQAGQLFSDWCHFSPYFYTHTFCQSGPKWFSVTEWDEH